MFSYQFNPVTIFSVLATSRVLVGCAFICWLLCSPSFNRCCWISCACCSHLTCLPTKPKLLRIWNGTTFMVFQTPERTFSSLDGGTKGEAVHWNCWHSQFACSVKSEFFSTSPPPHSISFSSIRFEKHILSFLSPDAYTYINFVSVCIWGSLIHSPLLFYGVRSKLFRLELLSFSILLILRLF